MLKIVNLLQAHAGELILWAHMLHPNVLPFSGVYLSEEAMPRTCIVSPWMENGDLLQYLMIFPNAPLTPLVSSHALARASLISTPLKVRGIVSGLKYLHDFEIVHADLKAVTAVFLLPINRLADSRCKRKMFLFLGRAERCLPTSEFRG
jgi:serine/threonine protein kinase